MDFKEEKIKEIEKLKEQLNAIEKLKELRSVDIPKLSSLEEKAKKYLHKLQTDEFEIAIVGLEKAGKSTFANALIEADILPSAPERCTFTSTKLKFGEDKAIVEFFTEEEFNEKFQELLKEIEYPDYEKINFKTMSLSEFERYWNKLEEENPNLHRAHTGKTDEEIKDILKYKDKLILTGEVKEFRGDELYSEAFKVYIKGEKLGNGDDASVDTSKPRSVKRIEIYSTKLNKLKTAVIYDVPGFDSPTKLHEQQTIERLKKADAIILVTNAGRNPSLLGTQLNILTKHADEDGIRLNEKLFVFGNQLDLVNEEKDIKGNEVILRRDVQKYKIARDNRVFVGSALKYLVEKGKHKPVEFKFDVDSGIEKIYKELINYYQTDRFKILQSKVEKNRREIKELIDKVLDSYKEEENIDKLKHEERKIIQSFIKKIEKNLEEELRKFKNELKKEIHENRYFSNSFKEKIQSEVHLNEITQEFIEKVKLYADENITLDIPIERINHYARKELHSKFLKDYTDLILEITNKKAEEVSKKLLDVFLNVLVEEDKTLFNKFENEAKRVIKELTKEISHDKEKFVYLIERFSRDIFDILIGAPLKSVDREDKYEKAKAEFLYLDYFYSNGEGKLIEKILVGDNDLNSLLSSVQSVNKFNKNKVVQKIIDISIDVLKTAINKIKTSTTEEDVLSEINTDIKNLKDILEKAVVPATNLDLAFLNGVDKQVKLIIKELTQENGILLDFILKIAAEVRKTDLALLENQVEDFEKQKKVINELKTISL